MRYRVTVPRGGPSAVMEVEHDGDINAALREFAKCDGVTPDMMSLTLKVDEVRDDAPVALPEPDAVPYGLGADEIFDEDDGQ